MDHQCENRSNSVTSNTYTQSNRDNPVFLLYNIYMSKGTKKIDIFIIPIEGVDVKFTYSNNIISYHFQEDGKNYGNALNILPEGKKRATIESSVKGGAILMLNAIESIKSIKSNDK